MPLYEYQCQKCHHRFEKIRQFSDPPIKKCPECGGPVEQLISAPAVQFKGSGWYVTDYGRSGSANSKSKGAESTATASSGEKDGGAKSSEKSETKTAAKKETKTESKS